MSETTGRATRAAAGEEMSRGHLPGTKIEIIRRVCLPAPPSHALFDFDGTLSLIREGWPDVIAPMMVEILLETGTGESVEELQSLVSTFVVELTGMQTIYQMMRLADEVRRRGAHPKDPVHYKRIYHDRLMERIQSRREDLRSGRVEVEARLVPGSLPLLEGLRDRGVQLYLASGTDVDFVRDEVHLLQLDEYFVHERVHGALDDYKAFSKAQVIERILADNDIGGAGLVGWGDGYVEIENTKAVGATAVAVASDEAGRSGEPDPRKRQRLIAAGADVVVADFREHEAIVDYLWRAPDPEDPS